MKRFIISVFFVFAAFSANAYNIMQEQAERLCKVVDTTLLNQLPVLIELRNGGMSKRDLLIVGARANYYEGITRYANWPAREAIGAMYDENAKLKTAEDAVRWIEARCVRDLRD